MTVVAILNVLLAAMFLTVIVGVLMWAMVTQKPDRRRRSLHLFHEPRLRSSDLAPDRGAVQPQISQGVQ